MRKSIALCLLALAALCLPAAASAQGFYLGAGFGNVKLGGDLAGPASLSNDLGFVFDFGFKSNPYFALDFGLGGSQHTENASGAQADYSFLTVGPKFIFPTRSPITPYLVGGVSWHDILYDFGFPAEISGWGYFLGAGVEGLVAPTMSLGLDARWHTWSSDAGGTHWDNKSTMWSLLFNFHLM